MAARHGVVFVVGHREIVELLSSRASDSERDGRLEEFAEEVQRGGQHSVNNRVFTYWRVGKEQDSSGTKSDDASRVIQAIADSSSVVLWRLAVDKSTCLLTQFSTTLCEKKR